MAPTLEPGDRVLGHRVRPDVGDVVVAVAPSGRKVVKRVVAVGPAVVGVESDTLLVDGTTSSLAPPGGIPGSGEWQLEAGQVFLLSDAPHRTDSDSRSWGPLPVDAVVGVVSWRYRPLRRIGRVA